jgi:hypothetical protein
MLTQWINVLLPYGKSALAEQQNAQAALDDEKAKVRLLWLRQSPLYLLLLKVGGGIIV